MARNSRRLSSRRQAKFLKIHLPFGLPQETEHTRGQPLGGEMPTKDSFFMTPQSSDREASQEAKKTRIASMRRLRMLKAALAASVLSVALGSAFFSYDGKAQGVPPSSAAASGIPRQIERSSP